MPLYKIKDFDPNYRQHFDDRDILKFDVYSGNEKIGSVDDLLVDGSGQFRYFVINTGAWIVGKKVLLPIGQSRIDENAHRVFVDSLTHDQVKRLPEYKGEPVDYDYEERVRGVYRPRVVDRGLSSVPAPYDRTNYHYDRDPALYQMNEREHEYLRRSEGRFVPDRPMAGRHRRSIGVFPDRRAAEQALYELRDSGFPMDRVAVVARDADKRDELAGAEVRDRVGNKADEGATIGAVSGGALGGLTGLLVGLGTLTIPGLGPVMLAGATATALATTLAGGAIGAVSGGLLGALIGLGIPEDRARVYQDRIARGGYLVIVDGTDAEIARAEAILHRCGIEDYGIYDAPTPHHPQNIYRDPFENDPFENTPLHRRATEAMPVVPLARRPVPPPYPSVPPEASGTQLHKRSAVGFFPNLFDAEQAIVDLRGMGFPLHQITLVARNLQRRDRFAGVDLRDSIEARRIGIPDDQIRVYNDRIGRGGYMVVVQGTEDELNRAAPILHRRGIQDWRIYDPADVRYELPVEAPRRIVAVPEASVARVASGGTGLDRMYQAVGFFSYRRDAEQAIEELRRAGFPLGQISLVAQRFDHDNPFTGVNLRDRFDNSRFGFPEERVRFFNTRIAQGDYFVVIRGTREQLRQAEAILHRPRIHDFDIYADPTDPYHDPRIGQPRPDVTAVDRRDQRDQTVL